jgi:hypothetical protein
MADAHDSSDQLPSVAALAKRTTESHHTWPIASNLLGQDFTVTEPDEKWGGGARMNC